MDSELEYLPNWLPTIGFVTISWTPIERHVDQCLEFLAQAGKLTRKPTLLVQKLAQIQRHAPSLGGKFEGIEELVDQTEYIVKIRNIFVHGVVVSCNADQIIVGKSDTKKVGHHIEHFTITIEQVEPTIRALQVISHHWASFAENLRLSVKNA